MHSQNLPPVITRLTGRVQHITEVQVQELQHAHIVHPPQVQAATEAAHLQVAAVVEVTIAVEVAAAVEAAVVHIRVVAPVEVLLEVAEADLPEVVHHPLVADNFRKLT